MIPAAPTLRANARPLPSRRLRRRAIAALGVLAAILGGLALAWHYTSLAQYATAEHVSELARSAAAWSWTPLAVVLAYPVAAVVMFPRPLITLFAVVAFGPFIGFLYAMLGVATSASVTYLTGKALPDATVKRLVGHRLDDVRAIVERRGLVAMLAISIVPVAPFIVVGAAAGAMRVAFRDYIGGVLLGHVPGTLTTSIIGGELKYVLEGHSELNRALVVGAVLFLVATILVVRRWFGRERRALRRDVSA